MTEEPSPRTAPTPQRQPAQSPNEARLNALFKLSQLQDKTFDKMLDFGLEEALPLTGSKIGYIYYYNESTKNFTLHAWSASVMSQCAVMEKHAIYPLEKTGLWGEAVRQRRALVTNDYTAPNPYKKGYPEGHVHLIRHMNLPIIMDSKIVAVIGVGNKATDYTEEDVTQMQLFMEGLWNIAERVRAEEKLKKSEEKFRTVADLTNDWEYWRAPNGDLLYCSPACEKITGYTPDDFYRKGDLTRSIVHPADRRVFYDHLEREEQDTEGDELEFRIITRSGEEKWIWQLCRPVFSSTGASLGKRVSNRDITDKKRNEMLLVQSNEEIRRLNDNILTMLKVMSHDIRNPLFTMFATLKLLQRGHYGCMDDSAANTVKDLVVRVQRILGIADDCLGKVCAVENHFKIEKDELDLRQEVVEAILEELAGEIEAKNITIDNRLGAIPTGSISVHASKIWLKAVYRNLFMNAIKYGGDGITIAYGYEDHGSHYKLCVYNNGPVIPAEQRDELFAKFSTVGKEVARNGLGMGLFLTKEIVNQHGGDIWYEEMENGGAFFFTLPK